MNYLKRVMKEVRTKWNKLLKFTTNTLATIEQKISSHTIFGTPYRWIAKTIKRKRTHYVIEVPLEYDSVLDYEKCVVQTMKLMEQKSIIKF